MENPPKYDWWNEENPVVLIHNGFEFTKNGVCKNPELIVIAKGKNHHLTISVAESPKGWCAGSDYLDKREGYRGGGSAASFGKYRQTYSTREEAIEKELTSLLKPLREHFYKEIKAYLNPKELTLF